MISRAKKELLTVIGIGLIVAGIALYSIAYARSAVRDDLRKQDITNLKRALEQYYNLHEFYPGESKNTVSCTASGPDSWLFGDTSPLLKEQFIDAIPHDVRESRGFTYSYCITGVSNNRTTAFYLQAMLESNEKEGMFFDEDEQRKFNYRVLREDGKTLYRVCGGEELQCKS